MGLSNDPRDLLPLFDWRTRVFNPGAMGTILLLEGDVSRVLIAVNAHGLNGWMCPGMPVELFHGPVYLDFGSTQHVLTYSDWGALLGVEWYLNVNNPGELTVTELFYRPWKVN